MQSRYKAGSAKQTIWEIFSQEGADAALKKGFELRIKETRLNRWFGRWKKRPAHHQVPNRKKVFDVGNPDMHGVVIQEGPDVSEIDWENGYTQFVANDMLLPVDHFIGQINSFCVMRSNSITKQFDTLPEAIRFCKKAVADRKATSFIYQIKDEKPILIPRKTWGEILETERGSRRRLSNKEIDQIVREV